MRRSLHFVPGGNEKMIAKALTLPADGLILDLEDAVTPDRKAATRPIVRRWLETLDFGGRERWVRMNPVFTDYAEADLAETIAGRPDGYVVPKPRRAEDVRRVADLLDALEQRHGVPFGSTRLVLIATETPEGLLNIKEIASASPRIVAVSWGIEDLSAAMGLPRTRDEAGRYLDIPRYARVMCAVAASAAGVEALDTVFTDIPDLDGLRRECREGVAMGFSGKISIHPSQIEVINAEFTPVQGGRGRCAGPDRRLRGAGAAGRRGLRVEGADDGHAASHPGPEDRGARAARGGALSRARAAALAALLLVSALVVYALPVGRRPLLNQDEARFALLAREAVESHHWLLPRVRGVIYLNKPPLYFWTVAALAKPFGVVNEATAPLASVLAALAALLAVHRARPPALGRPASGSSPRSCSPPRPSSTSCRTRSSPT